MTDPDYEYEEHVILDFVDDAVLAGPDAVEVITSDKLLAAVGAWIFGEGEDARIDEAERLLVELAQGLARFRGEG